MGLFDIFKTKKNEKEAINNIKKNIKDSGNLVQEVRNYWSQIIAGDINLENGEKFNQETFYNKKHLKFEPHVIKGVLVSIAITSDDKEFKEICQTCYMFLAAFEKKEVQDKIETRVAQGLPIIEEMSKIKNKEEKIERIKEYGRNLPKEKPGYTSEDLRDLQVHLAELFGRLVTI